MKKWWSKIKNNNTHLSAKNCCVEVEKLKQEIVLQKAAAAAAAEKEHIQELQSRITYIDAVRELLEKLTLSLDIKQVMNTIIYTLDKVVPFNFISFVTAQEFDADGSSILYTYSKVPVGTAYFSQVKKELYDYVNSTSNKVYNVELLRQGLRGKMNHEFIKGHLDEDKGELPKESFIIPLIVREKKDASSLIGMFYLGSNISSNYTEEILKNAKDIATIAAFNLERLYKMLNTDQLRLQNLLYSMTNGVILFNRNKRVSIANPALEKITGLPCQDGESSMFLLSEFLSLFPDTNIEQSIDKVLETGFSIHIEELRLLKSFYEIFISPVRDYENFISGGVLIVHDITHMKTLERFNKIAVDRELKMRELKQEIARLRQNTK